MAAWTWDIHLHQDTEGDERSAAPSLNVQTVHGQDLVDAVDGLRPRVSTMIIVGELGSAVGK